MKFKISVIASLLSLFFITSEARAQNISTTTCTTTDHAGCIDLNVAGEGTIGIQITGTWSGTITFRSTVDNSTYTSFLVTSTTSGSSASTTTANGIWTASVAGLTTVRVVFTSYSSGTATVVRRTVKSGGGGGGGGGGVASDVNVTNNPLNVACVSGCTATSSDADDGSIAVAQTNSNANSLGMVFDGSVWRRLTIGTAGTASAQVLTVQGIASMTPVQVQSNSANLATVAKQPALGTAGSASADVITVQGVASMTPLLSALTTTAATTDAASTCYITSAASTNSTNCKNAAGNVYGVRVVNTTSTIYYLRMYNTSSAPTCSSATGFVESIPLPEADGGGAGISFPNAAPQAYGTGVSFCLTGGGGSTDNTNAATGVYVTILYK